MSKLHYKIRIEGHLRELKAAVADARAKYGRDFIRKEIPQGKLLDALDAGREYGYRTDCPD